MFSGNIPDGDRKGVCAVKMSWASTGRISEIEVLDKVRKVLEERDGETGFKDENEVVPSDTLARRIPTVVFHRDVTQLSTLFTLRAGALDRTLRVIGLEMLKPIYSLPTVAEF